MGATTKYGLRYPELDDPDDVPTDMQELASDIETKIPPLGYFDASGNLYLPAAASLVAKNATLSGSLNASNIAMTSPSARIAVRGPDVSPWTLVGGNGVVTTDANGGATVPWGFPVASVLTVIPVSGQGWGQPNMTVAIDDAVMPDTNGFSIRAHLANGAFVNGSIRFLWLALVALPPIP